MATVEKLTRNTTATEVARIIRGRILAGEFNESQFVRQETIAKELGVSRLPVREALAQLESEGLIVREKYRGAVVPKLSENEICEIYALRGMIEPYLLREAIPNIDDAAIEKMKGIVERSRKAEDLTEWADLNQAFHRALYEYADRPLSMQMLENLLTRADRYLKMQQSLSGDTKEESDAEHHHLLRLIADGEVEEAVSVLEKHIAWNARDVLRTVGIEP